MIMPKTFPGVLLHISTDPWFWGRDELLGRYILHSYVRDLSQETYRRVLMYKN